MFLASLELFDLPNCLILRILVFRSLTLYTFGQFKAHACCTSGNSKLNIDLSCKMVLWELTTHLDSELKLVGGQFVDKWINPKRRSVLPINSVVHHKELAVWRVDCDCFHCFKISRVHAFMEIAIIKDHTANIT